LILKKIEEIPRNREVANSSIMHRYNTRFQARNPVQVPKEQVHKEQVPKEQVPVSKEQVQVQDSQILKDTRSLQALLDRQCMGIDRVKNAIDVFSFLAVNHTLLHHPRFRQVVIQKIEEFRPEIEKRKTDAIHTFVSTYSPFNTCMQQNELLAARNALYYIPLLTAEVNKVDAILFK
jgi:hypothetical protein